jgi:hypothetical protein
LYTIQVYTLSVYDKRLCITQPRQMNWLEDQTSGEREECEGDREGAEWVGPTYIVQRSQVGCLVKGKVKQKSTIKKQI